jgi:hypothetical protein
MKKGRIIGQGPGWEAALFCGLDPERPAQKRGPEWRLAATPLGVDRYSCFC